MRLARGAQHARRFGRIGECALLAESKPAVRVPIALPAIRVTRGATTRVDMHMDDRTVRSPPASDQAIDSGSQARPHDGRRERELVVESLQLLRVADVCLMLRISKPTLWRLRRAQDFPEPMDLTNRVVAWRKTDVEAWLRDRPSSRTRALRARSTPLFSARETVGVSDKPAPYKR